MNGILQVVDDIPLITAELSTDLLKMSAVIDAPYVEYEKYTGSYTVESEFDDQILPTKNKVLINDILIKKMAETEVSNPYGGRTLYIGDV